MLVRSKSGRRLARVEERPHGVVVDTYRVVPTTHPDDRRSGAVVVHEGLALVSSVVHLQPFHVVLDQTHDAIWGL